MAERTGNALRVAVLANRKYSVDVATGAPADALAEYDAEETVEAIQAALQDAGHRALFLEADETLLDTVRQVRPDICFNIAEGLRGDARESHVPALLELLDIPYTGSKVLTHAISLDKAVTKQLWRDAGLPTAPFQVFRYPETPLSQSLSFPLFVKPVREGSGMGITAQSLVQDEGQLQAQVRWIIKTYHQPALVEAYLPGREFTIGLIGNRVFPRGGSRSQFYGEHGYHLFPVLEIDTGRGSVRGIYNAEAKSYAIDSEAAPGYLCPADIPAELETELGLLAVAAFEAIGALDVGRVDFRTGADGRPYLMEINTLPGLNPVLSDIVIAALAGGVAYPQLINEILDLACERYGMLTRPRDVRAAEAPAWDEAARIPAGESVAGGLR
ncbi:MAG: D-alanine--D-alanine ligase family protein [Anaerolineae bacterium]